MEYAGLPYRCGRCQDKNCSCKKEIVANPKLTLAAVAKLKHSDLSGFEAVDLFRPLHEDGDPSLDLVFGPGFRTIQPQDFADVVGHAIEVSRFPDVPETVARAPRGLTYAVRLGEETFDLPDESTYDSYVAGNPDARAEILKTARLADQPAPADLPENDELRAETPISANPVFVSTNGVNTNKRTEIGVVAQPTPVKKAINGQDSPVAIKRSGRPKIWASDAARKAASRGLELPATIVARARDIKPESRPRSHAPSVNESDACVYCDRTFGSWILKAETNTLEKLRAEREHFLPKRLVGDNGQRLHMACHVCNRFKSDRVFDTIAACRAWINEAWRLNHYESVETHHCTECNGVGVVARTAQ
jgi:hypothetical protein